MRIVPAVVLLVVALARPAHAGRCDQAEAHLRLVKDQLDADVHRGHRYEWGWGLGNGGVAIGLFGLALASNDDGARAEAYIGSGGSVLAAVLPVLLQRVPAITDAPRFDRMLAETPEGPERCALVAEADRLLARSAHDERFARGPVSHTINMLINGGGWLIIGFGWDRWTTSGLGAFFSIGLGELQIYTRPTGAMRAWSRRLAWTVAPVVGQGQTGLLVGGSF